MRDGRIGVVGACLVLALAARLLAQEQPAALPVDASFEVTSVKRVTDPTARIGVRSSNNGRLSAVFNVRTLVSLAYGYPDTLRDDQVVGGPSSRWSGACSPTGSS